ncbi:hypothetical protein [Labrys monachus]|uniref:DUF2249 domain-containing protein n=1 Tax=Labrys monachus TaxID=217067 RepID=A0ABU0FC64_9HYPH|nr:hypothetical protein [Labrys monachus]MDQ0392197.1 hypothetical protein [Labrys monachus]
MSKRKPAAAEEPPPDAADTGTASSRPAAKPRPRKASGASKAAGLSVLADNVLAALTAAGGADYLLTIARDDPKTFCALLTRILPGRIDGKAEGGGIVLRWAIADAGEAGGE